MAMEGPFASDLSVLVYSQTLKKLYQKVQSEHLPVFEVANGCDAAPYDGRQWLSY